jgi:hypothetical protein
VQQKFEFLPAGCGSFFEPVFLQARYQTLAAFVCAAAGPCAGVEHLRLRSQFGIGAGCCKRRMFIYDQQKFEFLPAGFLLTVFGTGGMFDKSGRPVNQVT